MNRMKNGIGIRNAVCGGQMTATRRLLAAMSCLFVMFAGGATTVIGQSSVTADEVMGVERVSTRGELVMFAGATNTPPGGTPAPVGAKLFFSFNTDPGSSNEVEDESGSGNDGTISGTLTWVSGGHTAASLQFPDNAYVNAGASSDFAITGPFTLSAWIKPTQNHTDVRGVICKGMNSSSGEYGFGWYNGKILLYSATAAFLSDDGVAPLNQWTHVACTLSSSGTGRIYIGGSEVKNGTLPMPQVLDGGTRPMLVGRWRSGYDFIGEIDEAYMFGRELTSSEVAALKDATCSPTVEFTPVFKAEGTQVEVTVPTLIKKLVPQGDISMGDFDEEP